MTGGTLRRGAAVAAALLLVCLWLGRGSAQEKGRRYVGSEACKSCHADEFRNFQANSKKAVSFGDILRMKKGLSESEFQGCFRCHTTGYGEPGGFLSEKETPQLKNTGCETCHGPGSLHVETNSPEDIKGKLTASDCEKCHSAERVESFRFKPSIYGGAH